VVQAADARARLPPAPRRLNLHIFVGAMWAVIRAFHGAAHLTLVTSSVMARELADNNAAPAAAIEVRGAWGRAGQGRRLGEAIGSLNRASSATAPTRTLGAQTEAGRAVLAAPASTARRPPCGRR
jgi:hypothetical protein